MIVRQFINWIRTASAGERAEATRALARAIWSPSVRVAPDPEIEVRRFFDNVHWTLSYACAALCAWLGVRHASAHERAARRWFAENLRAHRAVHRIQYGSRMKVDEGDHIKRGQRIADLGLAYPLMRRMLGELGSRLARGGAIASPEDVYWLEAAEVDALATSLETGVELPSYLEQVEKRKALWQRQRSATPPSALPEKTFLSRFVTHDNPEGSALKGYAASPGRITAPACVLHGPEEFGSMRPGDVIVAVTTTPAWTPLFAMASAVVTDCDRSTRLNKNVSGASTSMKKTSSRRGPLRGASAMKPSGPPWSAIKPSCRLRAGIRAGSP